jgi:hypothetical protein
MKLVRHSSDAQGSTIGVETMFSRLPNGQLWLRYHIDGVLDDLVLPAEASPERADNLWTTTCFEAFIRLRDTTEYLEFNFSPLDQWAAYHFASYREGMSQFDTPKPEIGCDASDTHFALEATLDLPAMWKDLALEVGLCVIVEEVSGETSHWALHHPCTQPDFHHEGGFLLTFAERTRP